MNANAYQVTLTDRPDPIRVVIKYIDMVVAEAEAPRQGIPTDPSAAPLSLSLVWVWCALRRMGAEVGEFQHFRNVLLDDLVPIRDVEPVDPTEAATASP